MAVKLICDDCGTHFSNRSGIAFGDEIYTVKKLRSEAKKDGWDRKGQRDICPTCAEWINKKAEA